MYFFELVCCKIYRKNICFGVNPNGGKSDRVLQPWTEVCHQSFSGWEVQTIRNLQKNFWCGGRSMF